MEMNKREREEVERIKRESTNIDGTPLLKAALKMTEMPKDMRAEFLDVVKSGFKKSGDQFLLRAFIEKDLTEEEFIEWKKVGMMPEDWSPILQAFYMKRDRKDMKGKSAIILTSSTSPSYKNREKLSRQFRVKIVNATEAIEIMKKDDPEQYKRFEEWERKRKDRNN